MEYLNKPASIFLEMQNLFKNVFLMNLFLFEKNWSNSLDLICPAGYASHSQIGFLWIKLCRCALVLDVFGAKSKNLLSGLFLCFYPS